MTQSEITEARKLQATLTKISVKEPVFFNVAKFMSMGLIKEHGTTSVFINGNRQIRTNWILTDKGNQFLNVQL